MHPCLIWNQLVFSNVILRFILSVFFFFLLSYIWVEIKENVIFFFFVSLSIIEWSFHLSVLRNTFLVTRILVLWPNIRVLPRFSPGKMEGIGRKSKHFIFRSSSIRDSIRSLNFHPKVEEIGGDFFHRQTNTERFPTKTANRLF